jgi:hypothetical protein
MVAAIFNCEGINPSRHYSPLPDNSENLNLQNYDICARLFDEHRQEDRSDAVTVPHYYYFSKVDCTKHYRVVVKYRPTKKMYSFTFVSNVAITFLCFKDWKWKSAILKGTK